MKWHGLAAWLGWGMVALGAPAVTDAPPAAPPAQAAEEETPPVEKCIPAAVGALGPPAPVRFPHGIQMAVTTADATTQAFVNQGLNHLHGGWEFEASRNFAAAMKQDPECLLAHWGMVMSLLAPSPETGPAQNAAARRLLSLLEAGKGSPLERGLCYALIQYIQEGPAGAASAFRKVADRFPEDMQARILAALFSRGGYDASGEATPDQQAAEKTLAALVDAHPADPLPLNALLTVRAEAPDLADSLELARKLCQMAPDYPPYFHLLGHYEWRCGNHLKAATAFSRASSFYEAWMKANQTGVADCPGWVRSECYRIVAIASRGEFDTALAAARQLAATRLPAGRTTSAGVRQLLWEGTTLPARLVLHRGPTGKDQDASDVLPPPAEILKTRDGSLAYWWIDGLRFALEARRLMDAGKTDEARDAVEAFAHHGQEMAKTQQAAARNGERSSWIRAFRAIEILASDLRGRLAMAGPKSRLPAAYNWFASAADCQRPATMLAPPMILTPMAARLGDYHLAAGQAEDAVAAYRRALNEFPSDIPTLKQLAVALDAAGQPEEATRTRKRIAELTED